MTDGFQNHYPWNLLYTNSFFLVTTETEKTNLNQKENDLCLA